jgi:hypothetical protein
VTGTRARQAAHSLSAIVRELKKFLASFADCPIVLPLLLLAARREMGGVGAPASHVEPIVMAPSLESREWGVVGAVGLDPP